MSFGGGGAGPRLDLLPGAGPLTFAGSWVHSRGNTADEDTSTATMYFTNNMGQPIGTTDGTTAHPNGNRLFFTIDPYVVSVYSGTVAGSSIYLAFPDGTATFTNPEGTMTYTSRPYYTYSGIVGPGTASGNRVVRYIYSSNVRSFGYRYRVSTPVQYEYGWITIAPSAAPILPPGGTASLTATVYDAFGAVQADGISWASSNTAVATVDASGVVTAVGEGSATITATSTVNAQRTGARAITVDAAPSVSGTTPTNNAAGVAATDDIVITFSEAVNVSSASFTLECPTGSSQTFTVSGSGTSTVTLNPVNDLPAQTTCAVGVAAAQVSDVDANDGPNLMTADYVVSFEVGFTIDP